MGKLSKAKAKGTTASRSSAKPAAKPAGRSSAKRATATRKASPARRTSGATTKTASAATSAATRRGPGESPAVTPNSRVVRDSGTQAAPTTAAAALADRTKKITGREAARRVLAAARGPMHVDEITSKVLQMPGVKMTGKTPKASIAAMLVTAANKGDTFVKTAPNTFALRT